MYLFRRLIILLLFLLPSLCFAEFEIVADNGTIIFKVNTTTSEIIGGGGEKGDKGDPGINGTTPKLGVDYFNGTNGTQGEPGYTPILGVDYFNGTNGINGTTPVLGVDYFNGTAGIDGTNGTNGSGSTIVKGTELVKAPWVVNSTTTIAHGLGVIPDYLDAYFTCKTTDVGWAVGDIIKLNMITDTGTSQGFIIYANTTNISLRTGLATPRIINKGTGAEAQMTAGSWNITIVPYDFQE